MPETSQEVLIESIIKRDNGTTVVMKDETQYHFTPDTKGRHVCLVSDGDHVETLLAISEGFRFISAVQKTETAIITPISVGVLPDAPAAPAAPVALVEPVDPAATADPVLAATADPVEATEPVEPVNLVEPAAQADNDLAKLQLAAEEGDEQALEKLRAIFKNVTGRTANVKSKPMTLVATIEATIEENAGA